MAELTVDRVTTTVEIDRTQIHAGDIILFDMPDKGGAGAGIPTPALVAQTWHDRIDTIPIGSSHVKTIMADYMKKFNVRVVVPEKELIDYVHGKT